MTAKERAAMQQALEALETLDCGDSYKTHNAAAALRAALAEQAEQERKYGELASTHNWTPPNYTDEQWQKLDQEYQDHVAEQTNTQLMEGFRPVSEMVAEHKQDPKKAAAIEKAKMRKAEQKPVAWHYPQCEGQCIACLIEKAVQDAYGTQGRDYMLRHINAAPVRTKDLTDDEIAEIVTELDSKLIMRDATELEIARAVIAADRRKNRC